MAGHGLLHHLTLSFLPCTVFSGLRKAELGGTEMRLCVLSILISVTFLGFSSKAQSSHALLPDLSLQCSCYCASPHFVWVYCIRWGEFEAQGQQVRVSCPSALTLEGHNEPVFLWAPRPGVVSKLTRLSRRHAKVF